MARDLDGRKFTYALLVTYVVRKQNAYMARDLDGRNFTYAFLVTFVVWKQNSW